MKKVHSDSMDFTDWKPGQEATFIKGSVFELTGLTPGSLEAINKLPDGVPIKVICLAPGKFEVWA